MCKSYKVIAKNVHSVEEGSIYTKSRFLNIWFIENNLNPDLQVRLNDDDVKSLLEVNAIIPYKENKMLRFLKDTVIPDEQENVLDEYLKMNL